MVATGKSGIHGRCSIKERATPGSAEHQRSRARAKKGFQKKHALKYLQPLWAVHCAAHPASVGCEGNCCSFPMFAHSTPSCIRIYMLQHQCTSKARACHTAGQVAGSCSTHATSSNNSIRNESTLKKTIPVIRRRVWRVRVTLMTFASLSAPDQSNRHRRT